MKGERTDGMDEHLKVWIQRDAAALDRAANMRAVEYVQSTGNEDCTPGNEHARQLGGVQALASHLLFTLKQAGLYAPGEVQE
jgi:hypothetical protein